MPWRQIPLTRSVDIATASDLPPNHSSRRKISPTLSLESAPTNTFLKESFDTLLKLQEVVQRGEISGTPSHDQTESSSGEGETEIRHREVG